MTQRRVLGTALALLAIVAAIALGRWQWDRSRTELPGTQLTLAGAVPLDEALGSDAVITAADGQVPVTVSGAYDLAEQRVVPDGGGPGLMHAANEGAAEDGALERSPFLQFLSLGA